MAKFSSTANDAALRVVQLEGLLEAIAKMGSRGNAFAQRTFGLTDEQVTELRQSIEHEIVWQRQTIETGLRIVSAKTDY